MVVDDLVDNRALLQLTLESQYDLCLVDSGQACLEQVNEFAPAIVLLDVCMPGMKGTEVCHRLKSNPSTDNIQVVMISATEKEISDTEAGYYYGCDDYILKPFDERDLLERINTAVKVHEKSVSLKAEWTQQQMKESVFQDTLLTLVEKITDVDCAQELAELCFKAVIALNLECTIMLRDRNQVVVQGDPNSLELKLLKEAFNKDRCIHFEKRCLLHTKNVAVLIKNLSRHNASAREKHSDYVDIFLRCIEVNLRRLQSPTSRNGAVELLMLKEGYGKIVNVSRTLTDCGNQTADVVNHLHDEVERMIMSLALSEEQEIALSSLVDDSIQQLGVLLDLYSQGNKDLQESLRLMKAMLSTPSTELF